MVRRRSGRRGERVRRTSTASTESVYIRE
jgi:hypothetical protein